MTFAQPFSETLSASPTNPQPGFFKSFFLKSLCPEIVVDRFCKKGVDFDWKLVEEDCFYFKIFLRRRFK